MYAPDELHDRFPALNVLHDAQEQQVVEKGEQSERTLAVLSEAFGEGRVRWTGNWRETLQANLQDTAGLTPENALAVVEIYAGVWQGRANAQQLK